MLLVFFCYLLSFKIQVKSPIHLKLRPSNDVSISLDSLNLVANFEKKTCILFKRFFYTRQPNPFLPTTIVSKFTRLNFFYSHCLLLYHCMYFLYVRKKCLGLSDYFPVLDLPLGINDPYRPLCLYSFLKTCLSNSQWAKKKLKNMY